MPGRGIFYAFSGGGRLMSAFYETVKGVRGKTFPFNVIIVDSACWSKSAKGGSQDIAWVIATGEKEWGFSPYTIPCAVDRFAESLNKTGSPDIVFRALTNQGHIAHPESKVHAEAAFERTEIAVNWFLWPENYKDLELAKIVKLANEMKLGKAHEKLTGYLAKKSNDKDANEIKEKLEKRIERKFEQIKSLIKTDPFLAIYYAKLYTKQLELHPLSEKMSGILSSIDKKTVNLYADFVKEWPENLSGAKPSVSTFQAKNLKHIIKNTKETSLMHIMANEYLQYKKYE